MIIHPNPLHNSEVKIVSVFLLNPPQRDRKIPPKAIPPLNVDSNTEKKLIFPPKNSVTRRVKKEIDGIATTCTSIIIRIKYMRPFHLIRNIRPSCKLLRIEKKVNGDFLVPKSGISTKQRMTIANTAVRIFIANNSFKLRKASIIAASGGPTMLIAP